MLRILCVLLMMLAAFGCSSDGDPPRASGTTVGPAGGTVRSADGKVTLEIPPNALAADRTITIEPSDVGRLGAEWTPVLGVVRARKVYELGPSGTTFAVPVRIRLKMDDEASPVQPDGKVRVSPPLFLTSSAGRVEALKNQVSEVGADKVLTHAAETDHFSPLVTVRSVKDAEVEEALSIQVNQPDKTAVGEPYTAQILVESTIANWSAWEGKVRQESTGALRVGMGEVEFSGSDRGIAADVTITCTKTATDAVMDHLANVTLGNFWSALASLAVPVLNGALMPELVVYFATRHACVEADVTRHLVTAVVTGTGNGTITTEPAGISCSNGAGTCQTTFRSGSRVGFRATPEPGSRFKQWTVATTGTANPAELRIDQPIFIGAEFELLPTYPVSVTVSGTGQGTVTSSRGGISCTKQGGTCTVDIGGEVTLTATPSAGSKFTGWGGAGGGGTTPVTLTMDGAKNVSASFELLPQLTVQVIGDGEVSGAPLTVPCTGTCSAGVNTPANQVTLTATSQPTSVFSHWGGAASGQNTSVFLGAVDVDTTVTATFITQVGAWIGSIGKVSDTASHDAFVFNVGTGKAGTLNVASAGGTITITGGSGFSPSSLPTLTGAIQPNKSFVAIGTGTIAGFDGVRVEATGSFVGTATGATLSIPTMVVGAAGGTLLPTGTPITYSFAASK